MRLMVWMQPWFLRSHTRMMWSSDSVMACQGNITHQVFWLAAGIAANFLDHERQTRCVCPEILLYT